MRPATLNTSCLREFASAFKSAGRVSSDHSAEEEVMKLLSLTCTDNGHRQLTSVAFLVADHPDPAIRKEWLSGQFATDVPTARNGLLLRAEVLRQARDILDALANHYEHLGRSST